jgi:hypothetical protein
MMIKRYIHINRSEAVRLYWLLEGYENLFSFTTLKQPIDNSTKNVMVVYSESSEKEADEVLASILSELDSAVFS